MKNNKVLITGISGFIGQALSDRLMKAGYEVHGMLQDGAHANKVAVGAHPHIANLMDRQKVEALIKRVQPDYVIHLAALTEVELSFKNYENVSKVNYVGTVVLAEACRQFIPNLKLFVMASTMETYGHHEKEDGAFTEETKQRPRAPYAVAKIACEYYLRYMHFAYGFPFTALRQTNAYGRHDNDYFVVERIITQMLQDPENCRLGDPDPWRNFLYIEDLLDLYVELLKNPEKVRGEFFVTGPNNVLPIHKLADLIKKKLNWKGTIQWHTRPKRPGEIYYLNSDPDKAKKFFGWEPKVSLSDGLDRTIKVWQDKYASQKKQIRTK